MIPTYQTRELNHQELENIREVAGIEFTTSQLAHLSGVYLGVLHKYEWVGFGMFIPHHFLYAGTYVLAFQIFQIWNAPSAERQHVLQCLFKDGQDILKKKNGAFIFCFPATKSCPLFLMDLGFQDKGGFLKVNIPRISFLSRFFLTTGHRELECLFEGGLYQNNLELINLKQHLLGETIVSLEDSCNTSVWGKLHEVTKFGVHFQQFRLGGLNLNNPLFFKETLQEIFNTFRPLTVELTFHVTSNYRKLLATQQAKEFWSPLLMRGLLVNPEDFPVLNFSAGLMEGF